MSECFKPSENCWRVRRGDRVAVLVDGKDYFQALHEAILQARRSVFILGWDLHSEVRLIRNGDGGDTPSTLGAFLDFVAKRQRQLEIYLLSWDFAMIYALEREFFPRYRLTWRSHRNIHFRLDDCHPVGGSQHQKVVVIDDALAFAGGLDVSKWRWDTSEHKPDDPQRIDPEGKSYPPFHDIQMVVDGAAAAALGELARERWQRAVGKRLPDVRPSDDRAPWPESVEPVFHDIDVAIARTMPLYRGHAEIREVERLYLDMIAAARRYIYIENQYLSSYRIGEALQASLSQDTGPEIVIVLPKQTGGWLEQHTMDVLRGRIMVLLREADRGDRLRIYYPRLAVKPPVDLMVHAKLMVIDDRVVRVGSSNLSNRSLGLDSECDLAVAARPDSDDEQTIGSLCNRLLAEHLGVSAADVARQRSERGSLIEAIEALCDGERTLVPLDGTVAEDVDRLVPESELLDPEKPIEPTGLLDYFVGRKQRKPAYRHLVTGGLLIAAVLGLAAAWRWTPLNQWLDIETVHSVGAWLKDGRFTPLLVLAAFIVGGCAAVPVTLMVIGSLIIFGPWWGFAYALLGTQLSALCLFFLGRVLGKDMIDRFGGGLVNRLDRRLSNSGLIAVITLRVVPVAPFSLINLIAGVSRLRWRDFQLGTLIGMLPAITALAAVTDRLAASLRNPDLGSYLLLVAVIAVAAAALTGLRLWLKK
ncbi:VTT domain-containing protein [Desulfofustis glycolicus]|uniref:Phosphatidylserine/phosphatidylglycerophosphate/cardiolipin synthase n=1 Tax=Desulfofustis glycolicus DSM 9705 TaxID=1121409 RepID=A0A1M5YCU6_9BACT|nr:VTT domain-containing protein [Desulfofustis glycolicus]SHI09786.1 Phosphatidylserine/phosphatidylglycerophosphate/cardiolipin synthase [Desulfofustis glycolicus DSM 9705]